MFSFLFQTLKLVLLLVLVTAGIWYGHTHWLGYQKIVCDDASLPKGHICLKTVMDGWKGNVLWVDARSQDAFERTTIQDEEGRRHLGAMTVIPLRNDAQAQKLLSEAMPYLLQADAEGQKIVVFCDKSCNASDDIAEKLKNPNLGLDAPVYVLEGGWDALRRDPRLNTH